MIRAALLTPNFSLGGAERWILQLLEHVDPARVQWTGLGVSGHGGADPELCRQAAKLTTVHSNLVPPARRSALAHPFEPVDIGKWHPDFISIVRELTKEADCVLTWGQPDMRYWFPGVTIPRICCSHSTIREPGEPRPISGLTHLAGCAEIALKYFDDRPGLADLPRQVVYNGSDPAHLRVTRSRDEQRASWGYGPSDIVVGHIGRHSPEKNYLALAHALPCLPDRYKAVYYGRDQRNYHEPAADLAAFGALFGDRFRCYLPEPSVGNILNALDVLVIASHNEACSLAMIEAWLLGVPVVATPVGSVPELQARFGQLVTPVPIDPSPEALADAIQWAAFVGGRVLAAGALEVAQKHFTIRAMADNWATYLEHVCSSTEKTAG